MISKKQKRNFRTFVINGNRTLQYVYDHRCGRAGVGAGATAQAVESVVGIDISWRTC